jgi:hypothetical protein
MSLLPDFPNPILPIPVFGETEIVISGIRVADVGPADVCATEVHAADVALAQIEAIGDRTFSRS